MQKLWIILKFQLIFDWTFNLGRFEFSLGTNLKFHKDRRHFFQFKKFKFYTKNSSHCGQFPSRPSSTNYWVNRDACICNRAKVNMKKKLFFNYMWNNDILTFIISPFYYTFYTFNVWDWDKQWNFWMDF